MDSRKPLSKLALVARSVAEDLGFVALADLSAALEQSGARDYRLIGGHMVTLHAFRWELGGELLRETKDADLGRALVQRALGD
jgi:hypothetical protein